LGLIPRINPGACTTFEIFGQEEDNGDELYEKDKLIYNPDKINIFPKEPTIEQLLRRINEEALDLAPDFQRHANIWKDDAKSRLIESILIRIPLPAFYLDATNEDKMWSIDPKDFLQPPAAAIARTLLSQASTGAIVLLHDGGRNRQQTVEALSAIIPKLKQQGYRFVTVPQLLQMQAGQKQPIADRKSQ
jgi:peptidoglycan/xylan/chitin deacetylase (PgdA/CDA1 family)